eukprot:11620392-Alexandrium_andersonii.AAC.1
MGSKLSCSFLRLPRGLPPPETPLRPRGGYRHPRNPPKARYDLGWTTPLSNALPQVLCLRMRPNVYLSTDVSGPAQFHVRTPDAILASSSDAALWSKPAKLDPSQGGDGERSLPAPQGDGLSLIHISEPTRLALI